MVTEGRACRAYNSIGITRDERVEGEVCTDYKTIGGIKEDIRS